MLEDNSRSARDPSSSNRAREILIGSLEVHFSRRGTEIEAGDRGRSISIERGHGKLFHSLHKIERPDSLIASGRR